MRPTISARNPHDGPFRSPRQANPPHPRRRPNPRPRLRHSDPRPSPDHLRHPRRPRRRIPPLRLRRTLPQRARSRRRAASRSRRKQSRPRRYLRHHQTLEFQSPPRARPARFPGQPRPPRALLSRSLSHPHALRLPTRRRSGPSRSKRKCNLRRRRHPARHLARHGKSHGPPQMPRHRPFRCRSRQTKTPLRIRPHQTGRRPGRIASLSPRNRAPRFLQRQRHRAPGFRPARSRPQARPARRSRHHRRRRTSEKDARPGSARLGHPARHRFAHHAAFRRSRPRKFRYLRPAARRHGPDQRHPNPPAPQPGRHHRRPRFHSAAENRHSRRIKELPMGTKPQQLPNSRDQAIRAALDQHWAASDASDFETEHLIYLDDAVLEYPQSGERTRGRRNIQAQRSSQPNKKRFTVRRIIGSGDLWVTEFILTYDGKPSYTVSIMEFKGDKVGRETQYFADPFAAPASRARWVERMDG